MTTATVIRVRIRSTRVPRRVMADIDGKTMPGRRLDGARRARTTPRVVVGSIRQKAFQEG